MLDLNFILEQSTLGELCLDITDSFRGKSILITGAGGSIGSELVKQLIHLEPAKISLLDSSEHNLYELSEVLNQINKPPFEVELNYNLFSVCDENKLRFLFENNHFDFVFHAAAYKHVPILESNIIAAVENNVLGTLNLVKLSTEFEVDKFIFISSDKAVRPTNIMGASKRLSEIICQQQTSETTLFIIVRFGNVIGSSGSVIPKFQNQIKNGGPLTVTHKDITRYFMSINEAVQLVIHASYMSEGSDVFILDMGKPIKILDLAKSLVQYYGLRPVVCHDDSYVKKDDTEIIIQISGLRPGEKLFEELLINGKEEKTSNPKIFKSNNENCLTLDLDHEMNKLFKAVTNNEPIKLKKLLSDLPLGYKLF